VPAGFVDCHSHILPSGDDGARTAEEALDLCHAAHARGTALLFATPHVWPDLPLDAHREVSVRRVYAEVRPRADLELRLGWELTPSRTLLREDPGRYVLEGTSSVLVEVPFVGPAELLFRLAGHTESAGLQPVIAHPERSEAVQARPELADELAARGWPLQVNATSLLGRHGPVAEAIAWDLLERGLAAIVAADGHRPTRPAALDEAWSAVSGRLGKEARRLFDGSALGLGAAVSARTASRAATPGA
jgi:protein-tyrosine phosphatase